MSDYQCFELRALDKPLSEKAMEAAHAEFFDFLLQESRHSNEFIGRET